MQGHVTRVFFPSGTHSLLYSRCFSSVLINQKCLIHKQKIYDKLNIPPKPKKPLSPYFKFVQQIRPTILKEFPDIKVTELVKVAAQRWNVLDSKLKEQLQRQHAEENIAYNKLNSEYEQNLTPEQKKLIKEAIAHATDSEEEKKVKRKSKELGKPRNPSGVFIRFLMSKQSEKNKYPSNLEFVKAVSQEWKNVSADVKAKLEEERKSEVEKYNKELDQWEQRMIKEGNLDVIRKGSLLPQPKTKLKK